MSKVRAICHKKALILTIAMYCVKKSTLGKILENALFLVCNVNIFINRFHVPRQLYFPKQIFLYELIFLSLHNVSRELSCRSRHSLTGMFSKETRIAASTNEASSIPKGMKWSVVCVFKVFLTIYRRRVARSMKNTDLRPPRRNPTLVTLTRPLWRRCALPSDNYAITEHLERMASQRRSIRRALTPWAHGFIG